MLVNKSHHVRPVYGKSADRLNILGRFILSTGFEITPVATYNYSAHPSIVATSDGHLLAFWDRGNTHGGTRCKVITSKTRTANGIEVWGGLPEEVLFWDTAPDPPRNGDAGPAVIQLHDTDGNPTRLMAAWRVRDNPAPHQFLDYWRYSDDDGATWDDPHGPLPFFGYENSRFGYKPVELTPGGDLLWMLFPHSPSVSAAYDCMLVASSDGGETWAQRGNIFPNPYNSTYSEQVMGRLLDGRLMALIRVDNSNNPAWRKTISVTYSSDEGYTWTFPVVVFPGWGRPNWLQLSSGAIVALTRHYDPTPPVITPSHNTVNDERQYSIYRLSHDFGLSWGSEQKLTDEFYMYSDLIEKNGILHVIHAWGNRTSLNRCTMEYMQMEVDG